MSKIKIKKSSKKKNKNGILIFLIGAIFSILGLIFTYVHLQPRIVIDEIISNDPEPFFHEFIIKNVGQTQVKNLKIKMMDPYVETINGGKFISYPGVSLTSWSILDDIALEQSEKLPFKLYHFGDWLVNNSTVNAMISLKITYKNIFNIKDEKVINLKTAREGKKLVWRQVGIDFRKGFQSKVNEELNRLK